MPSRPKKKPPVDEDQCFDLAKLLEPALSSADINQIREAAKDASPEEFSKILAVGFQSLILKGLANIPAPTKVSEIATLTKLFREAHGLDAKQQGPIAGFVVPVRSIARAPIQEAEVVEDDDDFIV